MLHFTTGKDAAVRRGGVGHPPLGPFPLPSVSMELEVNCSKGTFLPADIDSVFKDNTLSFEAKRDGCIVLSGVNGHSHL